MKVEQLCVHVPWRTGERRHYKRQMNRLFRRSAKKRLEDAPVQKFYRGYSH